MRQDLLLGAYPQNSIRLLSSLSSLLDECPEAGVILHRRIHTHKLSPEEIQPQEVPLSFFKGVHAFNKSYEVEGISGHRTGAAQKV